MWRASSRTLGLFATELDTFDGLYIFVPNSELWNKPLKNHSRNPRRLMSIPIGIAYDADAARAREILLEMARGDDRILPDPAPYVYVDNYGESSIDLIFRAWAPTAKFWDAQRFMIEEAKRRFDKAGIEIPFPQRIVHIVAPGGGGAVPGAPQADAARADAGG